MRRRPKAKPIFSPQVPCAVKRIELRIIMALFAVTGVACLDLTPTVVAESDASLQGSGETQSCMACLLAPSSSGVGCSDEWVACQANAICKKGLDCTIRDACYSQSDDLFPVCTLNCANLAGFQSQGDLTTMLALAWYHCAIDRCRATCKGGLEGGPPADAGVDASGDGASGQDAGPACTNAADEAVTMSPAFATAPRDCGFNCFSMPDSSCAKDCIQKTGLSSACATCWGDTINCGAKNCLAQCIDSTNPACDACTMQYCAPAFHACSGT
jgi:hypothetical protein